MVRYISLFSIKGTDLRNLKRGRRGPEDWGLPINLHPGPSSELLTSPARVRTRQQKVMQERRVLLLLLSLDVSCAVLPRSGAVRRGPSGHGHGTAVSVVPAVL